MTATTTSWLLDLWHKKHSEAFNQAQTTLFVVFVTCYFARSLSLWRSAFLCAALPLLRGCCCHILLLPCQAQRNVNTGECVFFVVLTKPFVQLVNIKIVRFLFFILLSARCSLLSSYLFHWFDSENYYFSSAALLWLESCVSVSVCYGYRNTSRILWFCIRCDAA